MPESEPPVIGTDPAYLRYQYGDAERLRVRIEAHSKFSTNGGGFGAWLLTRVAARKGMALADIGCGPGIYHPALASRGVRITAVDLSAGMLREALAQASDHGFGIATSVASAERLPFQDASFERVMANHMLYHVPDQTAALEEMRRVLRPGGRAVLATNARGNNQRMGELHAHVARKLGYIPASFGVGRFTLDHLELVRSVFRNARVEEREDSFEFPDTESVLRYYASGLIDAIDPRPDDGSHRPALLAGMRASVDEIIAAEGVFRSQKNAGCFIAEV